MSSKVAPALAASLADLGTETAFSVLARAKGLERAGREIIHLEIGEPDFDTPPHIVEAGARALADGAAHYCPAAGDSGGRGRGGAPPRGEGGGGVGAGDLVVGAGGEEGPFFFPAGARDAPARGVSS